MLTHDTYTLAYGLREREGSVQMMGRMQHGITVSILTVADERAGGDKHDSRGAGPSSQEPQASYAVLSGWPTVAPLAPPSRRGRD